LVSALAKALNLDMSQAARPSPLLLERTLATTRAAGFRELIGRS
jgi:hypothetical protein